MILLKKLVIPTILFVLIFFAILGYTFFYYSKNLPKIEEITEYKPKKSLSFLKFLSYLIVLLISFVALLIIIDTFNSFLYQFFPGLELIMFNLFETLKDIELFIKDLI